jgi:hypothetical protein
MVCEGNERRSCCDPLPVRVQWTRLSLGAHIAIHLVYSSVGDGDNPRGLVKAQLLAVEGQDKINASFSSSQGHPLTSFGFVDHQA